VPSLGRFSDKPLSDCPSHDLDILFAWVCVCVGLRRLRKSEGVVHQVPLLPIKDLGPSLPDAHFSLLSRCALRQHYLRRVGIVQS
jgi:hypothetical protein